jgi:hypothetical protein
MSFQSNGTDIGHQPAAQDLSGHQFRFVKLTPTGWAPCVAGDRPGGILQNKPSVAGRAAIVRILGVSKLRASAAITGGAYVGPSADGRGVTVTGATPYGAQAVEGAGAENALIAVNLRVAG